MEQDQQAPVAVFIAGDRFGLRHIGKDHAKATRGLDFTLVKIVVRSVESHAGLLDFHCQLLARFGTKLVARGVPSNQQPERRGRPR